MINKDNLQKKILSLVVDKLDLLENSENIEITEIGDGNVNYIFRVSSFSKAVIVKFADSFIRGSDTRKLSTKRSLIEYQILKKQFDLTNGKTVEVYAYDPDINCIVMEDASDYQVLREEMKKGKVYPNFAFNIAEFLYETLFKTTDIVLPSEEKKKLVGEYVNIDMCEISERLVFTEPYLNKQHLNNFHLSNKDFVTKNLYSNKKLHFEVAKLKNKFMNNSQSLIHGDLHAGSIFINENDIKVFDPEFAFYGPMGYDIGNVFASLIISHITSLISKNQSEEYIQWTIESITELFSNFIKIYSERAFDDANTPMLKDQAYLTDYLRTILSDSLGYAGTEIIRRTIGVAKVWDIEELQSHPKINEVERRLLNIGIDLIMERDNVNSVTDLANIITY